MGKSHNPDGPGQWRTLRQRLVRGMVLIPSTLALPRLPAKRKLRESFTSITCGLPDVSKEPWTYCSEMYTKDLRSPEQGCNSGENLGVRAANAYWKNLCKRFHLRQTGAKPSLFEVYMEIHRQSQDLKSLCSCPAIFTGIFSFKQQPSVLDRLLRPMSRRGTQTHVAFVPKDFAFPWHSPLQANQFTIWTVFVLAATETMFISVFTFQPDAKSSQLKERDTPHLPRLSSTRESKEI